MNLRLRLLLTIATLLLTACKPEAPKATDASPEEVAESPSPSQSPSPENGPRVPDTDGKRPRSFVHYLTSYAGPPDYGRWRWTHHDPATTDPAGQPQIAAVRHPAIGPYDSADPAVIGYHLLLLEAAGFDGAILPFDGFDTPSEKALHAVFDLVREWSMRYDHHFSLMLMLDAAPYGAIPPGARAGRLATDLQKLLATYGVSPVYQRLDGNPVLLVLPKPDPQSPGDMLLTPALWQQVRRGVHEGFHLSIANPGPQWRNAADAGFGWPTTPGNSGEADTAYLDWLYGSFDTLRAQGWPLTGAMGLVMPGYDDAGVYGWTQDPTIRHHVDRTIAGKPTLSLGWETLIRHNDQHPEAAVAWAQTVSWNDWANGTEIEPSLERGRGDAEQAAQWNHRFTGATEARPAAWGCADAYWQARQAGRGDDALADGLERFAEGDYEAALRLLVKRP